MIGGRRGERKRDGTYYPSYRPSDSGADAARKILRKFKGDDLAVNQIRRGSNLHSAVNEADGSTPVFPLPFNMTIINESLPDNATTAIDVAATVNASAVWLVYNAHTLVGATHYYESGVAVLHHDGTNAAVTSWSRGSFVNGRCLVDDTGIDADVNGGNLRLRATTLNLGAACDFRASVIAVEA